MSTKDRIIIGGLLVLLFALWAFATFGDESRFYERACLTLLLLNIMQCFYPHRK